MRQKWNAGEHPGPKAGTLLLKSDVGTDIPTFNLVDPTSIQAQDVGRFLQEMQNVVMPQR